MKSITQLHRKAERERRLLHDEIKVPLKGGKKVQGGVSASELVLSRKKKYFQVEFGLV